MAVTAGTGGNGTVDDSGGVIFEATAGDRDSAATSIQVWCDDDSAAACLVEVSGVHDTGEGLYLNIGKTTVVRFGHQEIKEVTCYSATDAASATISWGVVAKVGAAPM